MNGEIVLGRGEFEIAVTTGRPPSGVRIVAEDAASVLLEAPRILRDGFSFRARSIGRCRICYDFTP